VKLYTIPEANALLPHLAPALLELRTKYPKAIEIREKIGAGALNNGGAADRERWNRVLARVQELMDRIDEWELQLRDLEDGLVDFPAEIDGGPAFLCWKLGEERVAYWHRPTEGFAGRRPL
jgi:hypothetical protein